MMQVPVSGSQMSPMQHSEVVVQEPPMGTQGMSPSWQNPSVQMRSQQSASTVQGPPFGTQVSPSGQQVRAPLAGSGAHSRQQHSSEKAHAPPSGRHSPGVSE